MLQRKPGGAETQIKVYGLLVAVELEVGMMTPEQAAMRISDALTFAEGVGHVDIEHLGEVAAYEEDGVK